MNSIGVGTSHWIVTPLPPNRTGGSPASGSPVGGSPTRGPEQGFMGSYKAEKPMLPKELVRPALMIKSTANSSMAGSLSQDTSNTAPHPAINRGKGPLVAMLKVLEPSPKSTTDIFDDHCQTMAIAASSRLRPRIKKSSA